MARLFLILIFIAAFAGFVVIVASALSNLATASGNRLRPVLGPIKEDTMASSGIQKAAYVALIVILFGTASGWLGGL